MFPDGGSPPRPTLSGFQAFMTNVMVVPGSALVPGSNQPAFAFVEALSTVDRAIAQASPLNYQIAVYNLAGDILINIAEDVPNAPPVPGTAPPLPYWAFLRSKWNINGFVSGVVQSAADVSTSESLVVQEAAKNFTLADLQNLKTPYGRKYLSIAQKYGNIWGLS